MSVSLITCTNCNAPLPEETYGNAGFIECSFCKLPVMVNIFPALYKGADKGMSGQSVSPDDESGCFFHPNKRAVTPCEICGRFLCSLCEIDFNNQRVCSSCIESGKKKLKLTNLEGRRRLYDNIALFLAVFPMLFVWPTIITAPYSIFLSIRHWKSPSSIIHRTKARFIFAILLSTAQLVGWGFVIILGTKLAGLTGE